MGKVPYSSCSMARDFRKVYLLENQEMCRCFLDFWRNLFVLNFQVTSRRFFIDSAGSLHSYVKFMFRLLHGHFPSPRVHDLFSSPWNLLPWDFLLTYVPNLTLGHYNLLLSSVLKRREGAAYLWLKVTTTRKRGWRNKSNAGTRRQVEGVPWELAGLKVRIFLRMCSPMVACDVI